MQEEFVDLGTGGPIRYWRGGNPRGETLLLLHGVHLSADYYAHLLPYLQDDYDLVAMDLRGHGKSFYADEPYRLPVYARDVVAFAQRIIGKPCHLLGMSLGGNVALTVAAQMPQLIRKLVVVDIAPFVNQAGLARIASAQQQLPQSFPSFAELQEFFYRAYAGVSASYIDEVLRHMWRQQADGSYVTTYDRRIWQTPIETVEADFQALAAAVDGLSLPVLVLRGANSDILTREGAQRFLALLNDGCMIEIDDTDHGLLAQQPAQCASAIAGFLAG